MLESVINRRTLVSGAAAVGITAGVLSKANVVHADEAGTARIVATPGTYTASFPGRDGDVTVTAQFGANRLEDLWVVGRDSRHIGTEAVRIMREQYLASQTLNVDTVAGATLTSVAMRMAVENCFEQAGCDVQALSEAPNGLPTAPSIDEECDVVVVGTGLAAFCAAIEALNAGSSVIMLDKMPFTGGNTNAAEGQLNAVDPVRQEAQGVEDSVERFYNDTFTGGDEKADPELVRVLVENATDAVGFIEHHGVRYRDELFTAPGGLWCRAHFVDTLIAGERGGSYYIIQLQAAADYLGARIFTDATVTGLLEENGAVVGVVGERTSSGAPVEVRAKSVILATGGYARNTELAMQFDARVTEDMMSSNVPSSTGDGIALATAVGAGLANMELVQIHPLGDPQNGGVSTYVGDWIGAEYFMLVNKEGERFVAESERRDNLTNAELAQTDGCMYLIVDSTGIDPDTYGPTIDNLVATGHSVKANTVEELAGLINVPVEALQASFDQYNEAARGGEDPMGKQFFACELATPPFYASLRLPTLHYCMGGVKISTDAQVLTDDDTPIPGLYAGGEVTGGVQGANRLGANSLPDCVVFGRIAGRNAAANARE